jgi:sigma-E factor negative regulatory protein RseC
MEEIGKVIKTKKNKATVLIELPPDCESCEFSQFCRIDKNKREIICINNQGAKKGDVVLIGTKNRNFYIAIFFYFLLPLFLLISGILLGQKIWRKDLAGFILGMGSLIVYFTVFFFLDKQIYKSGKLLPEILSIKKNS